MGILSNLWNTFFKDGYSVINGNGSYDSQEYIGNIYNNPSFTLAELKKTKAMKIIEWGVFTKDQKGNKDSVNNHILGNLFVMPNKNVTWGEFLEYMTVWYDGKDNGFLLEKVVGMKSFAPTLNLYNPNNFNVYMNGLVIDRIEIVNPNRVITGDELENFMWIKQPNFNNDTDSGNYGQVQIGSTSQRGMGVIGSYIFSSWRWNNSIVKNSGKRSGIYSTDKPVAPDERKKAQQKVESENTLSNKGKALFVTGGMKFTPTDTEMKDADWDNGETKAHNRLVSSLGVPPELTGSGNSTFANRKEARLELYQEEILPWCSEISRRLNFFLKDWLKNGQFIGFKTGSIPALKTTLADAIKSLEGVKDRLTIDEYRAELSRMVDMDLQTVSQVLLVKSSDVPLDDLLAVEEEPKEDEE